jgi:hypothetical protein
VLPYDTPLALSSVYAGDAALPTLAPGLVILVVSPSPLPPSLVPITGQVCPRQGCWEAFCSTGRGSASAGFDNYIGLNRLFFSG